MDKLFLSILNMSLTGAFIITAICLARLPLKKAPKIISYCLWAVAGFRLVFPFSVESVFSLIPFKAQTIPPEILTQPLPPIDSGATIADNIINGALPAPLLEAAINPWQIGATIAMFIWLAGIAVMLVYCMVSFVALKRQLQKSANLETNIYEAENIKSPLVLGIFAPKIYIPAGLSTQEREYVILHEQTHIGRRDHIVKLAAYLVLCLHWFNPFAWMAFRLMNVDMEMSCDERVLRKVGGDTKWDYSLLLLSLASDKRIFGGTSLAFGGGGIKERIKNVLNFKKPSRVIVIAAVALVLALSVGFAVNKAEKEPLIETENSALAWPEDIAEIDNLNAGDLAWSEGIAKIDNLSTGDLAWPEGIADTDNLSNGAFTWPEDIAFTDNLGNGALAWPYRGAGVTSIFGARELGWHSGIDIEGPVGGVVLAAEAGEVIFAGYDGSYGEVIKIEHPDGMQTWYSHLKAFSVTVDETVERGQMIGVVGVTGRTTGPHLHFEVRVNDAPVDPLFYLDFTE
jgi:murein DD-endopeptidase MepM/ murein hydrolase activator NlpD